MIQRQQSLWLFLSAIASFLSYKFPFFSGTKQVNTIAEKIFLDGGSTFPLLILTGASIVLSLITIFLFKDRKLQFRLCLAGMALTILILLLYFIEMKKLSGSINIYALLVFAIITGFIMAAIGIRKDQKLVKTLDRLR